MDEVLHTDHVCIGELQSMSGVVHVQVRFRTSFRPVFKNKNTHTHVHSISSVDPEKIRDYFGDQMSNSAIKWLLNWGPIAGILCFPYQTHILSRQNGLSRSIVIGTILVLFGNGIRSLPLICTEGFRRSTGAFVMYHIGQAAIAAGGPFIMGSVSRLSCVWFLENERTIATAIAQTANGLGTTIGFLIGPVFADDLPTLFWISLIAAIIPAVAFLLYCPEKPAMPPSSASERSQFSNENNNEGAVAAWIESVRRSTKHPSYVTLVLSAGILAGANSAWQGVRSVRTRTRFSISQHKSNHTGTSGYLDSSGIYRFSSWIHGICERFDRKSSSYTGWLLCRSSLCKAYESWYTFRRFRYFRDKYGVSVQCALFLVGSCSNANITCDVDCDDGSERSVLWYHEPSVLRTLG